jgi:hypothetical protein
VQLYRGPIKIFSNWSSTMEGGLALMEDKAKEQVAGLEGMMSGWRLLQGRTTPIASCRSLGEVMSSRRVERWPT